MLGFHFFFFLTSKESYYTHFIVDKCVPDHRAGKLEETNLGVNLGIGTGIIYWGLWLVWQVCRWWGSVVLQWEKWVVHVAVFYLNDHWRSPRGKCLWRRSLGGPEGISHRVVWMYKEGWPVDWRLLMGIQSLEQLKLKALSPVSFPPLLLRWICMWFRP